MSFRKLETKISKLELGADAAKLFEVVQTKGATQLNAILKSFDPKTLSSVLLQQNENGCTVLGIAAEGGMTDMVKALIDGGAPLNITDFYGQTALHHAAEFGHCGVAQILLEAGADPNRYDNLSALHFAACKGHSDVVTLLVNSKANVNAQDTNGVSVLHCAVANRQADITLTLLRAGAKVNIVGININRTPLFMAVAQADVHLVSLLLKYRAKLNHTDDYGMTPLCLACLHDSTQVAYLLIDAGARVNIADNKENLPLHFAARNGNQELCERLLNHGSKMDVLNSNYSSPLHLAVTKGHVETVRVLVDKGCNVNLSDPFGEVTALHVAVNSFVELQTFNEILQILIEGGCNLDSLAFTSMECPLYRAIDQSKVPIALCLLQHGACPNVQCPFDVTLLQKACQKGLTSVVYTLLYSGLKWEAEDWLVRSIHQSGINPKLLTGYSDCVPTSLIGNQELYHQIQEVQYNPLALARIVRLLIRRCLAAKLQMKVDVLELPGRLKDFIMLRIL